MTFAARQPVPQSLPSQSPTRPARPRPASIIVLAALILAGVAATEADEGSASDSLIDRYLKAFETYDVRTMSTFWAEDVVYADPTFGATFEGREHARDTLLGMLDPEQTFSIKITSRFTTNDVTVLTIQGSATIRRPDGSDGPRIKTQTPGVVVLQVVNGKVVKHTDYVDYDTARRQVAEALSGG